MEGAGLTRQSSRERVQTPKAVEWNKRRSRAASSDIEDTIKVIEVPAAPQAKRPEVSSHLKERIVATKVKALTTKAGERPATIAATPNHSTHEKATSTANAQVKVLTDLVKSLLRAMEEQKEEHANQLKTLTKTFTQQIEMLKAQVTEIIEKIETQLYNVQPSLSGSPSYAEIARTPPSSRPSNIRTLTSVGSTPLTMTDTLYCTIDTSRVREEERSKVQPGTIRKAIEEEIRTLEGQENWRCATIIRDARNTERIRIVYRDEAELQQVKKAA
ncbi:hypothetical protein L207DRAFT_517696 [Hyaloscypha variabilis F]|uniref:Uncharacterized protein n=1 Tax=Hyaloscypha variabilis (strain UAMH 11265 / GT02V1 / F) TaxID=1149755 RepID=A0A2J6R557_HYAVF|nr:hypothetical protein L207DRAFT_517696 [Hyaloscypha variabilis F]